MSGACNFNREFGKTGIQVSLDRIVRHSAEEFDCDLVLVSIVDETNQTFVAKHGTELDGTPREISFCQYVVEGGYPLLVEDAREDARFANSPLVSDGPRIRSYAGSPITNTAGEVIGTLCLADQSPAKFSDETMSVLGRYADGVSDLIRLHEAYLQSSLLTKQLQDKNDSLRTANRVFEQAERVAKIGAWEIEVESGKLFWSNEVYRIHGLEPGKDVTAEEALGFYIEADRAMVAAHVERAIIEREPYEFEAFLQTAGGEFKPVHSSGEYLEGDAEHPARIVGVVRDISAEYEARSALEHAANHDSLTGLFNRHAFDRILQSRLNKHNRSGQEVILLILDLDGFKEVNDTFGHVAGDIILEEAAKRMRSAVLDGALLARWGGDEFVVVLPADMSIQRAIEYGHEIIEKIRHETNIGGRMISLTATCGLARSERHVGARELIRRADSALYHGKKRNIGGVVVYDAHMEIEDRHRQRAIREVQSALRNDRLFAGYQPIVDLKTGEFVGCEALMRLHSGDNNQLTANEVLPALIDPTLSRQVSVRMTDLVAREIDLLFKHFPTLKFVSLNATEGDLLSPHFAEKFLAAFRKHGVDPERIILEVTETTLLVNDAAAVKDVLQELKAFGVRIALDDFGTGFSSLSHLRDFPIDKVKIDKSFVQGMTTKQDARLIVQAVIGMAKSLGLEVIAEGVETEQQRALLLQMGCPDAQGFLFSPALNISQLTLYSKRNRKIISDKAWAA